MKSPQQSIIWLQAGGCSGDTMSLLNAENPSWPELLDRHHVDLIWHPSLSTKTVKQLFQDIDDIVNGNKKLDILCVEGSLARGPNNTGLFDAIADKSKRDIFLELAEHARYIVAMGTCAAFGGVTAAPPNPTDACGLQSFKGQPEGILQADWLSKETNTPVINLSGCPVHPKTMIQTIQMLLLGQDIPLNAFNQPEPFYNMMVHQGCSRNEYHEYDIEESEFGNEGCLFYNLGCQGPYTAARCNVDLWNNQSSKPRAGVPCLGCVSPDFPRDAPLFKTDKVGDIPVSLPLGVSRASYMAYKDLAKDAAPIRIIERQMKT